MRRNFADVLKQGKIDIKKEYDKLWNLFYGQFYLDVQENFRSFYFRGTCLTIEEFNEKYGFEFEKFPANFNIDYLIGFCEYFYNMMVGLNGTLTPFDYMGSDTFSAMELISRIIEEVGYMQTEMDGFIIFVEKSQAAISVSEIVPEDISYKVISYNHSSMSGDLEKKKATLLRLANLLEPKRNQLKSVDKELENDIFYLFNNLNIRHNNTDPGLSAKYKKYVANMQDEEIEKWYDEIYQMCLLAFLELDHIERKKKFNNLKNDIEK